MKKLFLIGLFVMLVNEQLLAFPIKGFSVVSWNSYDYLNSYAALARLKDNKANFIALNIFLFQENLTSSTVFHHAKKTPSDESIRYVLERAGELGLKVLLRFNVDVEDGSWRANIKPDKIESWFSSYRLFLLKYARIAQEYGVEMLSVGMELKTLMNKKYLAHWTETIRQVRDVYNGLLTYGANWDNIENVLIWNLLDVIGIDAYYPLTEIINPSLEQLEVAWRKNSKYFQQIKKVHEKTNKPVYFQEIGYPSADGAAKEPWRYDLKVPNASLQARCYQAALTYWSAIRKTNEWFVGMFWWSWGMDPNEGGALSTKHPPKNNPAEFIYTQLTDPMNGSVVDYDY